MRRFAVAALLASATAVVVASTQSPAARPPAFDVVEATITDMQRAMQQRRVTSRELVTQHLTRIALYEKRINAAISINPRALEEADARDASGRADGARTAARHPDRDQGQHSHHRRPTTGGALAFAN